MSHLCMYMLYSSFFTTETLTIVLLCRHGHPQTATCVHPHNHVIIRCHVTVAIQGRPFSIHHANSLLYSIFISNFIALCSICTWVPKQLTTWSSQCHWMPGKTVMNEPPNSMCWHRSSNITLHKTGTVPSPWWTMGKHSQWMTSTLTILINILSVTASSSMQHFHLPTRQSWTRVLPQWFPTFTSANWSISHKIFNVYRITAVELNGSLSMKRQQEALTTFQTSTKHAGPHVLILSNVGVVGLNLTCANIMVIIISLFSFLVNDAEWQHDDAAYIMTGYHVVSARQQAAEGTDLPLSSAKTSAHLSPHCFTHSWHVSQQHFLRQGTDPCHICRLWSQNQYDSSYIIVTTYHHWLYSQGTYSMANRTTISMTSSCYPMAWIWPRLKSRDVRLQPMSLPVMMIQSLTILWLSNLQRGETNMAPRKPSLSPPKLAKNTLPPPPPRNQHILLLHRWPWHVPGGHAMYKTFTALPKPRVRPSSWHPDQWYHWSHTFARNIWQPSHALTLLKLFTVDIYSTKVTWHAAEFPFIVILVIINLAIIIMCKHCLRDCGPARSAGP